MTIPFIAALLAMLAWSAHSDRTGERIWHTGLPPFIGGIALVIAGLVADPLTAFLMLVIATVGIYCFFGPFWTIPAMFLAEAGAAVGFAVINSIGNIGGFIGPSLVGVATQATGSVSMGLVAIGGSLILCGILAAGFMRYRTDRPVP